MTQRLGKADRVSLLLTVIHLEAIIINREASAPDIGCFFLFVRKAVIFKLWMETVHKQ